MSYNPPDNNEINFSLESTESVSNDGVTFNLAEEIPGMRLASNGDLEI